MHGFDYRSLETVRWDTDILNLVARIHEAKGRQEFYVRQKPVELDRLVEVAKVQSTEASNRIEGIVTTGTRMKALFAEKTTPRNRDESEILGYREVLNTIHESHDFIPVTPAVILQLHRDLMRKAGLSFGGRFKNVQNYINETLPDGSEITRFVPVPPYRTPDAVSALCDAYERIRAAETVDMLLVIPVFIVDFLCIHPFNDGNGRMSRLLTLLLLYRNGYAVGKYISLEKQIEKTKDRYCDALAEADADWHEAKNDPAPFIRYMLSVILACYTDFEQRVGMMREAGVRSTAYDLVARYADEKLGAFTGAEVQENCPSLGRTAVRDALKRLVEEGRLQRGGSGRSTFYVRIR